MTQVSNIFMNKHNANALAKSFDVPGSERRARLCAGHGRPACYTAAFPKNNYWSQYLISYIFNFPNCNSIRITIYFMNMAFQEVVLCLWLLPRYRHERCGWPTPPEYVTLLVLSHVKAWCRDGRAVASALSPSVVWDLYCRHTKWAAQNNSRLQGQYNTYIDLHPYIWCLCLHGFLTMQTHAR